MKLLSKIRLEKSILTPNELKELKGGNITNKNSVDGCLCNYNNTSSGLTNDNSTSGCSCVCK